MTRPPKGAPKGGLSGLSTFIGLLSACTIERAPVPAVDAPVRIDAAPDARPDIVDDSHICDPITQDPCPRPRRCTWIWDLQDNPVTVDEEPNAGHIYCAYGGEALVGEHCVLSGAAGAGLGEPDNCVRGSVCIRGTCEAICDLTNDRCPDGLACTLKDGFFRLMGREIVGTCSSSPSP